VPCCQKYTPTDCFFGDMLVLFFPVSPPRLLTRYYYTHFKGDEPNELLSQIFLSDM